MQYDPDSILLTSSVDSQRRCMVSNMSSGAKPTPFVLVEFFSQQSMM
jgi:hypothetical protein